MTCSCQFGSSGARTSDTRVHTVHVLFTIFRPVPPYSLLILFPVSQLCSSQAAATSSRSAGIMGDLGAAETTERVSVVVSERGTQCSI